MRFTFFTIFTLAIFFAVSPSAQAQTQDGIRVIVMGEDEGVETVSRSSNVFDRVLAELKESMFRHGFQMVDEEMLAVELGWRIVDSRPKQELISAAKLANSEAQANLYSRAMALFRIVATEQDLGYATKIGVRVEGELYDLESNTFLGAFELPRITASAPANCSMACLNERVGDKAREIAAGVGDILGRKLAYLAPKPGGNRGGAQASNQDSRCNNLVTSYTLEFKRINGQDISSIINTITNNVSNLSAEDSFPCYMSHDMMAGGNSTLRRYAYTSTASRAKLYDWLNMVVMELGMTPDQDVLILNDGSKIIIENILQTQAPQTVPTGSKFQ